jgi:nitric oxide reductase subunit B
LTIAPERARAFAANVTYYTQFFRDGRTEYAIPAGALTDPVRARQLASFFFWSAWAASTNRPGHSYEAARNNHGHRRRARLLALTTYDQRRDR